MVTHTYFSSQTDSTFSLHTIYRILYSNCKHNHTEPATFQQLKIISIPVEYAPALSDAFCYLVFVLDNVRF
jgi:hypothetical protein